MTRGIFITGTDTGVGKTYVACGIAAALRKSGIDVGVMKPAETGCRTRNGVLVPQDAVALARAAKVNDPLELINPYRYCNPVAPAVAAQLENKRIETNKIMRAFRSLAMRHEFMIVEGAGGIMVPLNQKSSYLDLAEMISLPVIIIARPSLGTINHTMLTVMAVRQRGLKIAGIVINDAKGGKRGIAERTNPGVIRKMTGITLVEHIRNGQCANKNFVDCLILSRKKTIVEESSFNK